MLRWKITNNWTTKNKTKTEQQKTLKGKTSATSSEPLGYCPYIVFCRMTVSWLINHEYMTK